VGVLAALARMGSHTSLEYEKMENDGGSAVDLEVIIVMSALPGV